MYSRDLARTTRLIDEAGGRSREIVTYPYGAASLTEAVALGADGVWWTLPQAGAGHRPSPALERDPGRLHGELHTAVIVPRDHDAALAFFTAGGGLKVLFDGEMSGPPFDRMTGMPSGREPAAVVPGLRRPGSGPTGDHVLHRRRRGRPVGPAARHAAGGVRRGRPGGHGRGAGASRRRAAGRAAPARSRWAGDPADRRRVMSAGNGGANGAGNAGANGAENAEDLGRYDVIVIGAGGAGMCTAIEAAAAGASVLVLEKQNRIGGMLHIANGEFSGAGTRRQRERGIDDSPERHFEDVLRLSHGKVDEKLAWKSVKAQGETVDWLDGQGFDFHPDTPGLVHGHEVYSVPRTYWGVKSGLSVVKPLKRRLEEQIEADRVRLLLNTRLTGAIVDAAQPRHRHHRDHRRRRDHRDHRARRARRACRDRCRRCRR
ncbi:FAD-dependent oxidoreductase [Nonomuraea ferruginea]